MVANLSKTQISESSSHCILASDLVSLASVTHMHARAHTHTYRHKVCRYHLAHFFMFFSFQRPDLHNETFVTLTKIGWKIIQWCSQLHSLSSVE